MAFLTPDKTYTLNGVKVSEKLITSKSGVKYYSNKKLETKDHKPEYITIHNTDDINEAAGTNDAEQYARATFNNNMKDVVVHYYIDETGCWHILDDDTVGYHAYSHDGNYKGIAIEIIMDGSGKSWDIGAEDRGARLAAALLHKYGLNIDRMVTHQHWSGKYCPAFILPHWATFKAKVETYLKALQAADKPQAPATPTTKKLYKVQVGAFSVKANAEAQVEKLKAAGFKDAFIKED